MTECGRMQKSRAHQSTLTHTQTRISNKWQCKMHHKCGKCENSSFDCILFQIYPLKSVYININFIYLGRYSFIIHCILCVYIVYCEKQVNRDTILQKNEDNKVPTILGRSGVPHTGYMFPMALFSVYHTRLLYICKCILSCSMTLLYAPEQ